MKKRDPDGDGRDTNLNLDHLLPVGLKIIYAPRMCKNKIKMQRTSVTSRGECAGIYLSYNRASCTQSKMDTDMRWVVVPAMCQTYQVTFERFR